MVTKKRTKTPGSGRKAGTPNRCNADLRQLAQAYTADAIQTLVCLMQESANDSVRLNAARALLDRAHGRPPQEHAQAIELPEIGPLSAKGRAVIDAMSTGELAPAQGAQWLSAIGSLGRIIEIDDLAARIAALEEMNAQS